MKLRLPILVSLLALVPACIEASRPPAGDANGRDTATEEDSTSTADVDVVVQDTREDSAAPVDTAVTVDTVQGCDPGQCTIDGGCVTDGHARVGSPCYVCDFDRDPTGWSALDEGARCDDGDTCTPSSSCTADGRCVGAPDPTCSNPPSCVTDVTCADGDCVYELETETCLIDGTCFKTADPWPGVGYCKGCDPSKDRFAWTPRTSGSCNDGDACTVDDVCDGEATCAGVELVCDDHIACTNDTCVAGHCDYALDEGSCLIEGSCYAAGVSADLETCRTCEPSKTGSAWSPATGSSCDDHDACTGPDICDHGSCEGPLLHYDTEPNDDGADFDLLQAGNVAIDAAFPSGYVQGNLNPAADDRDFFGYGMLMNLNSAKRKPKVHLRGLVDTASYNLCVWVRCGVGDSSAHEPTVDCPVGDPVSLPGSWGFKGCCTPIAGATEWAGALPASCTEDTTSTDLGMVRILVEAADSNQQECPGYILDWGAIGY